MIRLILCAMLALAAWTSPALAQAANGDGPTALPENFHGRVLYFGNHSGKIASIRTNHGGPRKDCIRPDGSCPEQIGGSLQIELTFDGDVVRGAFRGTGGLRESTLIGRRVGPRCDLYDPIDGSMWSGVCDSKNFFGKVTSVPNALVKVDLDYRTVSVALRDYAERDRRREAQAARVREYDYWRSQWEGYLPAEDRLVAAVHLASFDWDLDPLVPKSVAVSGPPTKASGGYYVVMVNYGLASGVRGWARARLTAKKNGDISCITFWDRPRDQDCRVFTPPQRPPEPSGGPLQDSSMMIPIDSGDGQPGAAALPN